MQIIDSIEWIKKNHDRFFRRNNIGLELSTNIISDALLLTDKPITVLNKNDWWIIGSQADWLSTHFNNSIEELFSRVIPFPEAGQNSIRSEVLLTAFAKDIVTVVNKKVVIIKGSISDEENFFKILQKDSHWERIIAFRVELK